MAEQKDVRSIQMDLKKIPVFADEVMVVSRIKAMKHEDAKKVEKEGNVELIFLDQLTNPPRAISRVVVSRATATGLMKILGENLQKMEKDLKDKSMPKNPQPIKIEKQEKGYLG